MKHLKNFQLFESKKEEKLTNKAQEMIDAFKKKYGTELDEKFDVNQIKLIESAFEFFDRKFIKNKIQKIILDDLGGVHGRWSETKTKKHMTLNPSIFKFKKEFDSIDHQDVYGRR
jgi:phosphoglucomutase